MLQNDSIDISGNLLTATLPRSQAVDFAKTMAVNDKYLYVKSGHSTHNHMFAMVTPDAWLVALVLLAAAIAAGVWCAQVVPGVGENCELTTICTRIGQPHG